MDTFESNVTGVTHGADQAYSIRSTLVVPSTGLISHSNLTFVFTLQANCVACCLLFFSGFFFPSFSIILNQSIFLSCLGEIMNGVKGIFCTILQNKRRR